MVETFHVTGGLLDALLAIAGDREPEAVSTLLLTSPAEELEGVPETGSGDGGGAEGPGTSGPADAAAGRTAAGGARTGQIAVEELDPGTPVFTDLYFPSAGRSVDAVFGVDVSVPHGQAQGRFVSHPLGELGVSKTDDLHEVVLVAVPPWTREDVAAFDRSGRRLDLRIVAAAPPERPFDG